MFDHPEGFHRKYDEDFGRPQALSVSVASGRNPVFVNRAGNGEKVGALRWGRVSRGQSLFSISSLGFEDVGAMSF
jgi:hypothetical protein